MFQKKKTKKKVKVYPESKNKNSKPRSYTKKEQLSAQDMITEYYKTQSYRKQYGKKSPYRVQQAEIVWKKIKKNNKKAWEEAKKILEIKEDE